MENEIEFSKAQMAQNLQENVAIRVKIRAKNLLKKIKTKKQK